jgi:hypothetical protein
VSICRFEIDTRALTLSDGESAAGTGCRPMPQLKVCQQSGRGFEVNPRDQPVDIPHRTFGRGFEPREAPMNATPTRFEIHRQAGR